MMTLSTTQRQSVLTTALPPAGTTLASAAERSNPADRGEPRVGILAFSLRNLTWTWRTFDDDILREWMGRINNMLLQQQAVLWRRRRSRGGGMMKIICVLLATLVQLQLGLSMWFFVRRLGTRIGTYLPLKEENSTSTQVDAKKEEEGGRHQCCHTKTKQRRQQP